MTQFTLVGHDSPTEDYPGPVVPIGLIDGDIVAAYATDESAEFDKLDENAPFVRHDAATRAALHDFDPLHQRLFALTREMVVPYAISSEGQFFEQILATEQLSHINPFLRLAMAKRASAPQLIETEWRRCAVELETFSPGVAVQYERPVPPEVEVISTVGVNEGTSRPFEMDVAALWRDLGATNVQIRSNPFIDLYLEQLNAKGGRIRTAVSCKFMFPQWFGEERIDIAGDYFSSLIERKEVDSVVLLCHAASEQVVADAINLAPHLARTKSVRLMRFEDLLLRRTRLLSNAVLICEHERGTLGLHRAPQYVVTQFQELRGDVSQHESYVRAIRDTAREPAGPLTIIDLTQEWMSGRSRERHGLVIEALHAYQEGFRLTYGSQQAAVRRHFVVSPKRRSRRELSEFIALIRRYVEASIEVSLSLAGAGSSGTPVSAVNALVRRFLVGHEADSEWHDILAPERQSIATSIREHGSRLVLEGSEVIRSVDDVLALIDEL